MKIIRTKDDSLDVKKMFWRQSSFIPGTSWSITGYSRSAYRTGFYIKELDMMLDAGPQCFNHPSHIFITHCHGDHIASLPFTLIGDKVNASDTIEKPVIIYGPQPGKKFIENYIDTLFTTNAMMKRPSPRSEIDKFYKYSGWDKGDSFNLTTKGIDLIVEVFKCHHGIPTISYGFTEIKKKIKPEYIGIPGKEIVELKKNGTEITHLVTFKKFAYVCDTTIKVFKMNPTLILYPVIFIECTFLFPEDYELSKGKKHIHWNDLEPYVKSNPNVYFILFHFSQRYKDKDIGEFVGNLISEGYTNINWW